MRASSFFPGSPERRSDAYPMGPDRAEVDEINEALGRRILAAAIEVIEEYPVDSAEELGALRDLELWGEDPWLLE